MSEIIFNWRGVFYALLLIILWLVAGAVLGCGHMRVTNEAPTITAKPDPGRF